MTVSIDPFQPLTQGAKRDKLFQQIAHAPQGGQLCFDKGCKRLINLCLPLEQGLEEVALKITHEQGTFLFFRQVAQVVSFKKN